MSGILAAQDISYDRDIYLQSHQDRQEYYISNVNATFEYVDIGDQQVNEPNIVQTYFLERFMDKLSAIHSKDTEFFSSEQIQKPNNLSLSQAYTTIKELALVNIFPEKLGPSADDGICIEFKNKKNYRLHFELYNNGELGYIVENPMLKKIIRNEDVNEVEDAIVSIQEFIE